MPLDDTSDRRRARNVLGGALEICSLDPRTGFTRSGCCETGPEDVGSHTVCAEMTAEFLAFSQAAATTSARPARNGASPACSPATAGASAPRAGRRRSRLAWRLASCSAPPTPWRCNTAVSRTCSATPCLTSSYERRRQQQLVLLLLQVSRLGAQLQIGLPIRIGLHRRSPLGPVRRVLIGPDVRRIG